MKQKTARGMDKTSEVGDLSTFVAIDARSKLVPCWHVDGAHGTIRRFIDDLRGRITNRSQITTDAFRPYHGAIERAFDRNVDCAQLMKVFGSETNEGHGRYSSPRDLTTVLEKRDHASMRARANHRTSSP